MAFWFIALIVLQLVLFLLSALLAPKPKFENARPKALGDFQFPTATETRAVPMIWGTIDIKGPNVIWYGHLKTVKIIQKISGGMFSSSKKVTIGFRYFIGMDLALGYGPLNRITRLEVSNKELWSGALDVLAAGNSGATLAIDKPKHLGGREKGGGIVGSFKIYAGLPGQVQDPYLQGQLGSNIPAYVDIAHAVWQQGEIGESTRIDPYIFRVTRFPDNLSLTGDGHIVNGTVNNGDANPAEVLYEIMTNDNWGLDLDPSKLDFTSFQDAGNTLATEGSGFSLIVDQVTTAEDIIKEILRQIDAAFYENSDGVWTLILIRDDFTFGSLPIFDESNILEYLAFSRGSWATTQNHLNIGYSDRNKDFMDTGAMAQDIANVRVQGKQVRADANYPGVKYAPTARDIANRELQQLSYPLAKIEFLANRDAQSLRPGDAIRFRRSKLGITDMVVRVMTVDLGDLLNGKIKVVGMQDVFRLAETIYTDPQDSDWSEIDNAAVAFTTELVRPVPRILMNLSPEEINDPTEERVLSVAKRPAGQVTEFEQFVDEGAGAGYFSTGTSVGGLTPYAELENDYPKATADIEVSDLLLVDGEEDFQDLSDEAAEALKSGGVNLALIQGASVAEDEIIGWEQLIDEGNGTWTLRNVHRGLLDTQARDHSAGAKIWFFSEGFALSSAVYDATQAITVKHQSETSGDELALASASPLALTFASRATKPHHPADVDVNATRLPVATDETAPLNITWAHRKDDDLEVLDANAASPGSQDTDIEYVLTFKHGITGVQLRQEVLDNSSPPPVNGTWTSYNYTAINLRTDTGQVGDYPLNLEMFARYKTGGLTSLQMLDCVFNVDLGGAALRSVDMDGATEYLAKTANSAVNIGNAWTINTWVRPSSNTGVQRNLILIEPTAGNANRIALLVPDDNSGQPIQILLYNSAGTLFKDYSFGSWPTSGTWTLLSVTWDGSTLRVFQDSSEDTSPTKSTDDAGTMTSTSRQVIVGVDGTLAANYFAGLFFQLALWDSVLTPTEIGATYNSGSGSTFNLRANSGNYASRDDLMHLWDNRDTTDIGGDYGHHTALIDIGDNAAFITVADLSTTVP